MPRGDAAQASVDNATVSGITTSQCSLDRVSGPTVVAVSSKPERRLRLLLPGAPATGGQTIPTILLRRPARPAQARDDEGVGEH